MYFRVLGIKFENTTTKAPIEALLSQMSWAAPGDILCDDTGSPLDIGVIGIPYNDPPADYNLVIGDTKLWFDPYTNSIWFRTHRTDGSFVQGDMGFSGSSAYMTKAVYDTNNDGVVNYADALKDGPDIATAYTILGHMANTVIHTPLSDIVISDAVVWSSLKIEARLLTKSDVDHAHLPFDGSSGYGEIPSRGFVPTPTENNPKWFLGTDGVWRPVSTAVTIDELSYLEYPEAGNLYVRYLDGWRNSTLMVQDPITAEFTPTLSHLYLGVNIGYFNTWFGTKAFSGLADADIQGLVDGNLLLAYGNKWLNVNLATVNMDAVFDAYTRTLTLTAHGVADSAITTAKIANSAITTVKIAGEAVTASKIASSTITAEKLANSAVTGVKIANSTLTNAKIAFSTLSLKKFSASAIAAFPGTVADSSITSAKLADSAVTGRKIAYSTISLKKLTASAIAAIPSGVPADSSITTAKLANSAVTAVKIALSTITNNRIANSTLSLKKFSASAIAAFPGGTVADSSITTAKLANSAVTLTKIAQSTITRVKIATSTLTGNKIAHSTLSLKKFTASAIAAFPGGTVADSSITTAKLANSAVTAVKIAASTITKAKVAVSTLTGDRLAHSTLSLKKFTASAIAAFPGGTPADSSITTAKLAMSAVTEAKLKLADTTSGNATTGRHGYLPKLPGDTTNFMRADGSWAATPGSVPSTGGDLYLANNYVM